MNTKNLDAIKRMVTRLQSILETDKLAHPDRWNVSTAIECLQETIEHYDSEQNNTEEVRAD